MIQLNAALANVSDQVSQGLVDAQTAQRDGWSQTTTAIGFQQAAFVAALHQAALDTAVTIADTAANVAESALVASMLINSAQLQEGQIAASFNNIRDVTREVTFEETVKTLIMSRLTTPLTIAWNVVAILDPTPISDILETVYYAATGNWTEAGISFGFVVVGTIGTLVGGQQATNAVRAGRLADKLDAANDLRRLGRAGDTIGDVRGLYKAADPVDNVASSLKGASIGHCPTQCFEGAVRFWTGNDEPLIVGASNSLTSPPLDAVGDNRWLETLLLAGIGIGVWQMANGRLRRKEEEQTDAAFAELFGDDDKASRPTARVPRRKPPGGSHGGVGFQPAIGRPQTSSRVQPFALERSSHAAILDGAVDPLADSSGWLVHRAAQPCNKRQSTVAVLDTPRIKEHRDLLEPMPMSIATIPPARRTLRRARQSRFGLTILAVCLGLAAFLQFRPLASTPPTGHAVVVENAASPTPRDSAPRTIAMQEVDLCDRSVGEHPDRSKVDETIPDVDPPTWRRLQLRMRKDSGKRLWMKLIEPREVIERMGASVGGTIYLDMPEYGAKGEAEVLSLGPCPPVKSGIGNVVTGKFIHESDGDLVDLLLVGETKPTGVTPNHPYWSLDRREFVGAGDLRPGERVSIASGETTVASVEPRPAVGLLYNLRIHREHVYRVGELGVLVHNRCVDLYRVVGANELADIRATGRLQPHPGGRSLEVKQFVTSIDDAIAFAQDFHRLDGDAYTIVRVSLPKELAASLEHILLDQRQSVVVHREMLKKFNESITGLHFFDSFTPLR